MTVEDGYAIQRDWVRLELADGRTVSGHKIGLTSRAMQQASQITEPDYGTLLDDMFFEQGGDIPFDALHRAARRGRARLRARQAAAGPGRDALRRAGARPTT